MNSTQLVMAKFNILRWKLQAVGIEDGENYNIISSKQK